LLGLLGVGGLTWWLAPGRGRAAGTQDGGRGGKPRSLIVLWLDGGPSQLETFDPKPGTRIGGPTGAIATSAKGVRIADGLPRLAEQMHHVALLRSLTGKEGDHERATALMKTGKRPELGLVHPALGAVCASELPAGGTDIPRYVSILGNGRSTGGGFLGQRFNAFRVGDPRDPIRDVVAPVSEERQTRRLKGLELLEQSFERRVVGVGERTLHPSRTERALRMMRSPQLDAFRVDDEPAALRDAYGDHSFGRGCLAARRLVEVGVPCVEVTLGGWDTHVGNFEACRDLTRALDGAFSALLADLHQRDMLGSTLVVCTGEFGRTPKINKADGRDHWPTGFSMALAGGGIRGGAVLGETTDDGSPAPKPVAVADAYATVLQVMGIDPETEITTNSGRPVKLGGGKPLQALLQTG
jgi:hypothetical protein